jgi:hypothetical protein
MPQGPPRTQPPPLTGPFAGALTVRRVVYVAFVLAAAGGAVILYTYKPVESGVYPPCVFHKCTGLHCPGCGTTRALHALLHGRVWAAFRYNALAVLSLPVFALVFARYTRTVFAPPDAHPARRRHRRPFDWAWAALVLLLAFWVLRNLPFPPFKWLAPTDVSLREGTLAQLPPEGCRGVGTAAVIG